jgi:hypothetical protein
VVEAARPVHSSRDTVRHQWGIQQVRDPVTLIDYVADAHTPELPGIEKLATRGGIERRPIEIDAPEVLGAMDYNGFKITDVRVGIIESVCHREPCPRT